MSGSGQYLPLGYRAIAVLSAARQQPCSSRDLVPQQAADFHELMDIEAQLLHLFRGHLKGF